MYAYGGLAKPMEDEFDYAGNTAKGIGTGALQGAATGASFGPWGAAIGAVVGGVGGAFTSGAENAAQRSNFNAMKKAEMERKEEIENNLLGTFPSQGIEGATFNAMYGGKIKYKQGGTMARKTDPPKNLGRFDVRYHKRDKKFMERQMKRAMRRDARRGTKGTELLNKQFVYPGQYTLYSQNLFDNSYYIPNRQELIDYNREVPFLTTGDPNNPSIYTQSYNQQGNPNFIINYGGDGVDTQGASGTIDFARLTPAQKVNLRTAAKGLDITDSNYTTKPASPFKMYGGKIKMPMGGKIKMQMGGVANMQQGQMPIPQGNMETLASDVQEVEGPPHELGGVPMGANAEVEGGEVTVNNQDGSKNVFSDRIEYKEGMTFADKADQLGRKKGKYEEKLDSSSVFVKGNARRNIEKLDAELNNLFNEQEVKKRQMGIPSPEEQAALEQQMANDQAGMPMQGAPTGMEQSMGMGMEQGMPMGAQGGMPVEGMGQPMPQQMPVGQMGMWGGKMKYGGGGKMKFMGGGHKRIKYYHGGIHGPNDPPEDWGELSPYQKFFNNQTLNNQQFDKKYKMLSSQEPPYNVDLSFTKDNQLIIPGDNKTQGFVSFPGERKARTATNITTPDSGIDFSNIEVTNLDDFKDQKIVNSKNPPEGNKKGMGQKGKQAMGAAFSGLGNIANFILTAATPKTPRPVMYQAMPLKTDVDISAQKAAQEATLADTAKAIQQGTASAQTARANLIGSRAGMVGQSNTMYEKARNLENQLINQNRLNQQQATFANVDKMNQYAQQQLQRAGTIKSEISANIANAAQKAGMSLAERNQMEKDMFEVELLKQQYKDSGVWNRNIEKLFNDYTNGTITIDELNKRLAYSNIG
jgi:polyhydroxyalkanoate synthesis regulator phasin